MKPNHLPGKQKGISLVVTLLITVLLSLLALYGAGVLVLDTRSAANDYRYREAMVAAESGVDQGFSLLNANRTNIAAIGTAAWATCTATTPACLAIRADQSPQKPGDRTTWQFMQVTDALTTQPTSGSFTLFLLTPNSGDASGLIFNIVAIGNSEDGSSSATVKQGVYFYPLVLGNVDTPLASASNLPLNGNYCIVTNSNGGGSGVPVSIWTTTTTTVTGSGSFATAHQGDFDGTNCPNPSSDNILSKAGAPGPDIIQDPNFPPDLFAFLFGVSSTNYQLIKDEAQVVADCDGLDATSSGLIWVEGDCTANGDIIGSTSNPVMLIVEGDGDFAANTNVYGLLYMFDSDSPPDARELKTAGTNHMHGAIIAHDTNVDLDLQGTYIIEYDEDVLSNLKNSPSTRALARIPGSWSDVQ